MSGRWVAGIVGVLVVALVVYFVTRPPSGALHPESTHVEDAGSPDTGVETAPTPVAEPVPAPPSQPDTGPLPPPAAIPVAPVAAVTTPNHDNVAALARQVCARTAAGDANGLAELFGPGWRGRLPMDELRTQCSGDPTAPLVGADGTFGDARTVFDDIAVRHWAAESGLDAAHCYGLHLGDSRVMVCRDHDGQYRIAAVDFRPAPPPRATGDGGPGDGGGQPPSERGSQN